MPKQQKNNKNTAEYRVNKEISGYSVARVIYNENTEEDFNEVMTINKAVWFAKTHDLDLIEINPKSDPPVIRIADYQKFLYNIKKKQKANKTTSQVVKEIQLKTNISDHDLKIKEKKATEFLTKGNKVKVVLKMKGRELSRKEESKKCLYQFISDLSEVSTPETMPKDNGGNSIVILKLKKK